MTIHNIISIGNNREHKATRNLTASFQAYIMQNYNISGTDTILRGYRESKIYLFKATFLINNYPVIKVTKLAKQQIPHDTITPQNNKYHTIL